MNNSLVLFEKQNFLNVETFRKNGQGVKTPVWFVQDGETLLIWTGKESGKVQRIRRNGKVRVVPSNAAGEPRGEWMDASATVDESPEALDRSINLMKKKYGWQFALFNGLHKLQKAEHATVKIIF